MGMGANMFWGNSVPVLQDDQAFFGIFYVAEVVKKMFPHTHNTSTICLDTLVMFADLYVYCVTARICNVEQHYQQIQSATERQLLNE